MKKIFTLGTLVVMLFNNDAFSQPINEHFENDSVSLTANCWQFAGMRFAKNTGPTSGYVINGSGSLYSEPPVSQDSIRIARTPLLNVGSSISISFSYKLSNTLSGQQTRTIQLALTNSAGVIMQSLAAIAMDKNTNNTTSTVLFNQTFSVTTPGPYRLAIITGGNTGGGSSRLSFDDFTESAFSLGCPENSPLPVKLISFSGNLNNDKINLQWSVAQNEDDDRFEVEKSTDGKSFKTVAIVMASTKPGAESYSINGTMDAEKIYYRLKMFDKNEVITYSKTLAFEDKTVLGGGVLKVINPATDKLTLTFSSATNQSMQIKVYDMAGRLQMNQAMNVYQGSNLIDLPLSSAFKTGIYAVEMTNGSEIQTAKFVKQ